MIKSPSYGFPRALTAAEKAELKGAAGRDGTNGRDGVNGANGKDGLNGSNGSNGTNGRGITSSAITNGRLILTYSDGTTSDVGQVVGTNGTNGTNGASGATLLGTATLAESSLVTLSVGVRRVTLAVTGAVVGGNYLAFPVNALPAGYGIVDVYCTTAGQLTFGVIVPVLSIAGSYSIPVRVVRINAS